MSVELASPTLDEAFEHLAASGFELPNGFVNHGPMACEALAALGLDEEIGPWARRFARSGGTAAEPVRTVGFDWQDALGRYQRLPEWIGYFDQAIATDGWSSVVEAWVPRLMPALAVALYHGAIRSAHAVRAVGASDSPARQAELARALGYWAARFRTGRPGQAASADRDADDVRRAVVDAAADGARRYLARPDIVNLHGVTGTMAVEIFVGHIAPADGVAALAQVRGDHAELSRGIDPLADPRPVGVPGDRLARTAATSRDPHQVKLVEACRRGLEATGDPAFAAAAEVVTGLR